MPTEDGRKVWIEVDGQPLDEYRVVSTTTGIETRVECFIASEAGKNFSVHVKDESPFLKHHSDLRSKVGLKVDGARCRDSLLPQNGNKIVLNSARVDSSTLKRLEFSAVKLDAFEEDHFDEQAVRDLGTVKILIKYIRPSKRPHPSIQYNFGANALLTAAPLSEKAKKGGGNRSTLGAAVAKERRAAPPSITVSFAPKLIVVFTHAPRAWLQAKEIIPLDMPMALQEQVEPPCPAQTGTKKRSRSPVRPGSRAPITKEDTTAQYLTNEEAETYRQLKQKAESRKRRIAQEIKSEPELLSSAKTLIDLTID